MLPQTMRTQPQLKTLLTFTAAAALTILTGATAQADVLVNTYTGVTPYPAADLNIPTHENAQGFTLASSYKITSIAWSGFYYGNNGIAPATDNFSLEIFGDASGKPGTTPLATVTGNLARVDTGGTTFPAPSSNIFDFTLTLTSDFVLNAGTYYFDPLDNDPLPFYWAIQSTTSGTLFTREAPADWGAGTATATLRIEGVAASTAAVPEPSAIVLFGSLLAGVAVVTRKRSIKV